MRGATALFPSHTLSSLLDLIWAGGVWLSALSTIHRPLIELALGSPFPWSSGVFPVSSVRSSRVQVCVMKFLSPCVINLSTQVP